METAESSWLRYLALLAQDNNPVGKDRHAHWRHQIMGGWHESAALVSAYTESDYSAFGFKD